MICLVYKRNMWIIYLSFANYHNLILNSSVVLKKFFIYIFPQWYWLWHRFLSNWGDPHKLLVARWRRFDSDSLRAKHGRYDLTFCIGIVELLFWDQIMECRVLTSYENKVLKESLTYHQHGCTTQLDVFKWHPCPSSATF